MKGRTSARLGEPLVRKAVSNIDSRRLWLVVATCVVLGGLTLALVVRANIALAVRSTPSVLPVALLSQEGGSRPRSNRLRSRLSVQPAADKMRRLLGLRFLNAGSEHLTLTGVLTIGEQTRPVSLTRIQQDDGESVSVALGGKANLSWTTREGARVDGGVASQADRLLIERLVLDSPDQFVLGQLRGASYRVVATSVLPGGVDLDTYDGPTWEVVMLGEPDLASSAKALSSSRLYYINTLTGLIDRVVSNDSTGTIVAVISDWTNEGSEKLPRRIQWLIDNRLLMEFTLTSASFGASQ